MSDEIEEKGEETPPVETKAKQAAPVSEDIEAMTEDELREHLRKARKAVKAANSEAQAGREARKRLRELEEAEEERRLASLSEVEKANQRIKELERQAREKSELAEKRRADLNRLKIERAVEAEAKKQKVENVRLAAELLRSRENSGIDVDEETDEVVGVEKAVQKLLRDYPEELMGLGSRRNVGTPPRDEAPRQRQSHRDQSQLDIDRDALRSNQRIKYGSYGSL